MFFSWFKSRRRKRILAEPFPAAWSGYLAGNFRHYAHLERSQQAAVRNVVQVFVAEKHWAGGGGLTVTDEMKVTVAAQASLLTLGLSEPYYYDHVPSIIIYPRHYARPRRLQEDSLIIRDDWELAGEMWHRGPIVLSWADALASGRGDAGGHNVVLHEFAHHLDALNGEVDGLPPLEENQWQEWHRVTEAEYLRLVGKARRSETTLLDYYGATNRVEFFAVATECFFERPCAMTREHEDLYRILRDFYHQDPARWCPDAIPPGLRPTTETDPETIGGQDDEYDLVLDSELAASTDPESLFTHGVDCMNQGRYQMAVQAFSRAIELDPSDGEAYQQRALARSRLGEYAAALKDAQEALRLGADHAPTYLARGAARLGLRQYDEARADLDRVLKDNRDSAEAYFLRGLAWAALGKLRRAMWDFSFSIAIAPYSAEAHYHRAHVYRQLGDSAKADADLEIALQLDPQVGWRR